MLSTGGNEKYLAWLERMATAAIDELPSAGDDHIELISRVRLLTINLVRLVDLDRESAMPEQLDELAVLGIR